MRGRLDMADEARSHRFTDFGTLPSMESSRTYHTLLRLAAGGMGQVLNVYNNIFPYEQWL